LKKLNVNYKVFDFNFYLFFKAHEFNNVVTGKNNQSTIRTTEDYLNSLEDDKKDFLVLTRHWKLHRIYILNKINPVKSAEFMDKLSSGADLGKLSPILALRNKIIKARDSKNFHMEYSEIIKTIFYAWEKYLNNENVKVLKLPENYEINLQTSLLV
jgi:hypothetical protein